MELKSYISEALQVMENAYVPYSHYKVGSIVVCHNGDKYYGVNIENASYGATNCGERSAIFNAYSHGVRKDDIAGIIIVTSGNRIGYPCGICRQVLCELLPLKAPVILSNGKHTVETSILELLPNAFNSEDL